MPAEARQGEGGGAERREAHNQPRLRGAAHPLRSGCPPRGAPLRLCHRCPVGGWTQLRAALPGTRHCACPSPASSSQSGRSAGRAESRSRPSARLRASPAGTAPCSVFRTSPEDAPRSSRHAKDKSAATRGDYFCDHIDVNMVLVLYRGVARAKSAGGSPASEATAAKTERNSLPQANLDHCAVPRTRGHTCRPACFRIASPWQNLKVCRPG